MGTVKFDDEDPDDYVVQYKPPSIDYSNDIRLKKPQPGKAFAAIDPETLEVITWNYSFEILYETLGLMDENNYDIIDNYDPFI